MSVADLRRKFAAMHASDRVARAEDHALLASAIAVHDASLVRIEQAETDVHEAVRRLESARETEREWFATVQGLATGLAARLDARNAASPLERPAFAPSSLMAEWDFKDRRPTDQDGLAAWVAARAEVDDADR